MKQIVVFLTAMCAGLPAWAQDGGRWNYRSMEERVQAVCSGSNGHWMHPQFALRSLYRDWTAGQVFAESILTPEFSNLLIDFTQSHMSASESCFEVSKYYLTYQLAGFEALSALRKAFQDSGISENCAHTPADDDLRSLYLQCTKIDFAALYLSETGKPLVFSQDMVLSVRKRIANKLLIERQPTTCEQIEDLDDEIYRGFIRAQRKLRKNLEAGGFPRS